jgi:hypothetical protein
VRRGEEMRKVIRVVFVVGVAFALAGCNEPKQVTGQEFMAMHARNPETMRHAEFVGVKDGKAILKVSDMSLVNKRKWNDSYFVTDTEDLTDEWIEKNTPSPRE